MPPKGQKLRFHLCSSSFSQDNSLQVQALLAKSAQVHLSITSGEKDLSVSLE